ncbi:nicotinate-nucleotide--dimethylbenzimidazole phosphoribosyltransferase [Streptomyces sp. NPDC093516]|uniref:nicotinate-nucleotide--dimethylbenzimidazole phosphoribosyltransferase n=1 Tax=Streptomyces sp. NPDC093516 TaxID=3155304 RepID=UPI00341C6334
MTDTGQVPGEGLPENSGMVEQPGAAHGSHTYLSETSAEDEDLLLPGAQGAWGHEVAPPAPEPVVETVHEPGPHELSGRDSGSVDLGGVRLPDPLPIPPITPRRPLHLGPPLPDSSASPVRSLADRGPADAPVRQPAPSPGPEYLDAPRAAEAPSAPAAPWGAPAVPQPPSGAGAAPAETVVPAPEPVGAAQAVVTRVAAEAGRTIPAQAPEAVVTASVPQGAEAGAAAAAQMAGAQTAEAQQTAAQVAETALAAPAQVAGAQQTVVEAQQPVAGQVAEAAAVAPAQGAEAEHAAPAQVTEAQVPEAQVTAAQVTEAQMPEPSQAVAAQAAEAGAVATVPTDESGAAASMPTDEAGRMVPGQAVTEPADVAGQGVADPGAAQTAAAEAGQPAPAAAVPGSTEPEQAAVAETAQGTEAAGDSVAASPAAAQVAEAEAAPVQDGAAAAPAAGVGPEAGQIAGAGAEQGVVAAGDSVAASPEAAAQVAEVEAAPVQDAMVTPVPTATAPDAPEETGEETGVEAAQPVAGEPAPAGPDATAQPAPAGPDTAAQRAPAEVSAEAAVVPAPGQVPGQVPGEEADAAVRAVADAPAEGVAAGAEQGAVPAPAPEAAPAPAQTPEAIPFPDAPAGPEQADQSPPEAVSEEPVAAAGPAEQVPGPMNAEGADPTGQAAPAAPSGTAETEAPATLEAPGTPEASVPAPAAPLAEAVAQGLVAPVGDTAAQPPAQLAQPADPEVIAPQPDMTAPQTAAPASEAAGDPATTPAPAAPATGPADLTAAAAATGTPAPAEAAHPTAPTETAPPAAPAPAPASEATTPAPAESVTPAPVSEDPTPAPAPETGPPAGEDVTVVLPTPPVDEHGGQPVQGPQQSRPAQPGAADPAALVPAPRDGDTAPAQNADDLDTRAAEQEDLADQERLQGEGAPAVTEARESTGPAAPPYDPAEREAVLKVMRERRDIRNGFRSDPIPHEVLLRVLEAAHHAPSVGHSQPWDFVVIRSADTRRAMHELAMRQRDAYAKSLPKGRAKQFKELKIEAILDTPVNIVVTADPTRGGRHTLGRHTQPQMAPYSAALAVENLWLAARAEGLGVGWVSFFDEREMVRALGLPEHLEVIAYLCVGYVDEFPDEPELLQAGWSKRRPLSWVVHEETYGRRALPGEEPHDLLAETVAQIRPLDAKALGEAWERQKRMTKPAGALGMLEIISAQLSGLSRQCPPPIPEPAAVAIFAGDHGVHAQGVTPWPQEVTAQMVANFLGGGAVCNAFATQVGAEVCIVDVGVAADLPATPGLLPRKIRGGTSDMTTGPAMTREEARQAIEVGIETARDLVAAGNKALLTGEMGIGNTTASAALISVFTGADPAEVTGRGTGINDETLARKTEVVRRALELHQPDPADPIGVLAAIGGFEHAALVGLLLGGASLRTPVILDGVSAGAAALVARAIAPEVLAACIAGHRSAEPGHVAALNKLGLRPLVDLDLRLGEGTGALLALPLVQSTARAMHEVATFDSAGVTEK